MPIRGTLTRAAEQKYGLSFPSYHTGGVVGEDIGTSKKREIIELTNLKPNEVVAKLENGETVLTSKQKIQQLGRGFKPRSAF